MIGYGLMIFWFDKQIKKKIYKNAWKIVRF